MFDKNYVFSLMIRAKGARRSFETWRTPHGSKLKFESVHRF